MHSKIQNNHKSIRRCMKINIRHDEHIKKELNENQNTFLKKFRTL